MLFQAVGFWVDCARLPDPFMKFFLILFSLFLFALPIPKIWANSSSAVLSSVLNPAARSTIRDLHEDPPVATSPQAEETRLTGDWAGKRSKLSAKGIDLAALYKFEFNDNWRGGFRNRAEELGMFQLRSSYNLETLTGWKGASGYASALALHGGNPSENVGDLQGTSNIEAPGRGALKLYEAWLQQRLFENHLSILAGLHDLNSEFYATQSSALFFNNGFSIGTEFSQSGTDGPSIFPRAAVGTRVKAEWDSFLYVQAAGYDGAAGNPGRPQETSFRINATDGMLLIAEVGLLPGQKPEGEMKPGKYAIGFWGYTQPSARHWLSGAPEKDYGSYFFFDQSVSDHMALFFRFGIANGEIRKVDSSMSSGIAVKKVIPHRPHDVIGFALSRIGSSNEYKESQLRLGQHIKSHENVLELSYRLQCLPGFVIQPDYQYVNGTSFSALNAEVLSVRLELSL